MTRDCSTDWGTGVREYKLTGRFWIAATTALACGAAALFFRFVANTEWVRYYGRMRLFGLEGRYANDALALIFAVLAVGIFAWTISVRWWSRSIIVAASSLTIVESRMSGIPPVVIPLVSLRSVTRYVRPAIIRSRSGLSESLRETVSFSYGDHSFSFSNARFRSRREFDDFCSRIGAIPDLHSG